MPRALVALGANLGDRVQSLERAIERIARDAARTPLAVSRMHETAPVGGAAEQGAFLNAATAFETSLGPESLFGVLKRIERDLGRVRGERWGARAIDLDLLLYDHRSGDGASGSGQIVVTPQLQVPHPRMSFRRFVLEPASEVAPEMVHPIIGWSVEQLIDHLNHAASHVMVLGLPESHPSALAKAAAAQLGGGFVAEPAVSEEVAASSGPSGPAAPRPIQFLDQVASVLADPRWPVGATVISAFCVDGVATGERSSATPPQRTESTLPRKLSPQNLLPLKLLIVLEDWETFVAAQSSLVNIPGDTHRRELLRLAVHEYQGPVLCAGRTDFAAQLNEITAALVAMR
jgi:2-amino-4-hydroxy-6-hydroxymethyldihydropteridine diphosphokinase